MKALKPKPRSSRAIKAARAAQRLVSGEWLKSTDGRLGASFINDAILVTPLGAGSRVALTEMAVVPVDEFVTDYADTMWRTL